MTTEELLKKAKISENRWSARELMIALACTDWYLFHNLLVRVGRSCSNVHGDTNHFQKVSRANPKSSCKRNQIDYNLTAYACYLIVINGDPSQSEVAIAQKYFFQTLNCGGENVYQDFDNDKMDFSNPDDVQQFAFLKVKEERTHQDFKHGKSPRNLKPEVWLAVLAEEQGEVARAIIEGDSDNYAKELIQVAAVAIQALEDYYSGTPIYELEDVCPKIKYFGS